MSFDLRRFLGKTAPKKDKVVEPSQQFRKTLRERLEAARLSENAYGSVSLNNNHI